MSRQIGITEDGKPVIRFFDLVDTHGVPIDIVVEHIHDSGGMPAWDDFLDSALVSGWNIQRALLKLSVPVKAVYGDDWHAEWLKRAQAHLMKR